MPPKQTPTSIDESSTDDVVDTSTEQITPSQQQPEAPSCFAQSANWGQGGRYVIDQKTGERVLSDEQ
jgi:hypothetical protein